MLDPRMVNQIKPKYRKWTPESTGTIDRDKYNRTVITRTLTGLVPTAAALSASTHQPRPTIRYFDDASDSSLHHHFPHWNMSTPTPRTTSTITVSSPERSRETKSRPYTLNVIPTIQPRRENQVGTKHSRFDTARTRIFLPSPASAMEF